MYLASLVSMIMIFTASVAQADPTFRKTGHLGGSDAQLVCNYLGLTENKTGTVYIKAIVNEKHDPAFKYETRFMVNNLPQDISLSQNEQSELFQVLGRSGISAHTTVGGTQFNWILTSITCTNGSCDLEDMVETNFFGLNNRTSNSCFEKVGACAAGEKEMGCAVSPILHGVRVCLCCYAGD